MKQDKRVLEMKKINKSFYGVKVLHDVNLTLKKGEIMALLGENGAGKSTLMKILNGVYKKDSGAIYIKDNKIEISSPKIAKNHNISMVFQEIQYFPNLSIAENLRFGVGKNLHQRLNWKELNQWAANILKKFNIDINPRTKMKELSVGTCQIITILQTVSADNKIIVMDEPTAALNASEVEKLFNIIKQLKESGISIIYISHRLEEIMEITDSFTVLRDGRVVGSGSIPEINKSELIEMMTGKKPAKLEISSNYKKSKEDIIFEARNISKKDSYKNVSFKLYKGEILSISGLMGCGNKEILRTLYGIYENESGEMYINGKQRNITSIQKARKNNIGFVPEDRKNAGILNILSVLDNITVSNWDNLNKFGLFNSSEAKKSVNNWIDKLNIRMSGNIDQEIVYLSGGNQQKVILARWLEADCDILLLDEPTFGVDVGARYDIHKMLRNLAKKGLSIIIVSSDYEEVMDVSDRIIVMCDGEIAGEIEGSKASKEVLLEMALGGCGEYDL